MSSPSPTTSSKTRLDKPGVRRLYPLVAGDYDAVKAQIFGHFKTRQRVGKCPKCRAKCRNRWRMEHGRWKVTCCKCGYAYRAHGILESPGTLGGFDKWVFPVIASMSPVNLIDQLVAVQPMAGPAQDPPYELDDVGLYHDVLYRVAGTVTGRMRANGPNIQEIARQHTHPTPEEDFCPICAAAAELVAKADRDAREILVRNLQSYRPRPADPAPGVRTMWLDIIRGGP